VEITKYWTTCGLFFLNWEYVTARKQSLKEESSPKLNTRNHIFLLKVVIPHQVENFGLREQEKGLATHGQHTVSPHAWVVPGTRQHHFLSPNDRSDSDPDVVH
jgi:hypothetical protein